MTWAVKQLMGQAKNVMAREGVPSPPHVHPHPRDDGSPPPRGELSPSDGSPPGGGGGEPYTTPDQPILV